jgi:hypothetical protein
MNSSEIGNGTSLTLACRPQVASSKIEHTSFNRTPAPPTPASKREPTRQSREPKASPTYSTVTLLARLRG